MTIRVLPAGLRSTFLLIPCLLLISCNLATPANTPAVPTTTAWLDGSPPSVFTITPDPSRPPSPTPLPTQVIAGLVVITYELKDPPHIDPLYFESVQGEGFTNGSFIDLGERFADRSFFEDMHFSIWADDAGSRLVATEYYNQTGTGGWVTLTRAGEEIYRIETGQGSPVNALRGLWTYPGHWALETAFISQRVEGNVVYTDAIGQVSLDGSLQNALYGYEEAFSLQTIDGRPFYLFQRGGVIDAWYDGQVIPLGYDEVPHYGCCSAAERNPQVWQDMVAFFGVRGQRYYFVRIGISD